MSVPGVSLSKLGLGTPNGFDCEAGGYHNVPEARMLDIASRGGGNASCLKCGKNIEFVPLRRPKTLGG